MKGDILNQRLLDRIRESDLALVVHYPVARVAATTGPGDGTPVNPLTGTETLIPFPDPVTPAKPDVTLPCLWLDSYLAVGRTSTSDWAVNRIGWVAGATAVARVAITDAALDSDMPFGDTVFTGAESVEFQGRHYRVVSVQPIGSSFRTPVTYLVWLTGAGK